MVLRGYQIELVPIQKTHLEQLRRWRNSRLIAQYMLSQDEITLEQQQDWFLGLEQNHCQQHFSVMYKGALIGSANIKATNSYDDSNQISNAKSLETGLYIGDEKYRGNLLAFSPSLVLNDYCFNQLGVEKLTAVVHPENQSAIQYNLKLGYLIESDNKLTQNALIQGNLSSDKPGEKWVKMTLSHAGYDTATKTIKALLNRPKRPN